MLVLIKSFTDTPKVAFIEVDLHWVV